MDKMATVLTYISKTVDNDMIVFVGLLLTQTNPALSTFVCERYHTETKQIWGNDLSITPKERL